MDGSGLFLTPVGISSIFLANSVLHPEASDIMKKNRVPLAPFQTGQVWELEGSKVQISMVGKLLVHYRHYRDKAHRAPTSLASKTELAAFLRQNRAVLGTAAGCP